MDKSFAMKTLLFCILLSAVITPSFAAEISARSYYESLKDLKESIQLSLEELTSDNSDLITLVRRSNAIKAAFTKVEVQRKGVDQRLREFDYETFAELKRIDPELVYIRADKTDHSYLGLFGPDYAMVGMLLNNMEEAKISLRLTGYDSLSDYHKRFLRINRSWSVMRFRWFVRSMNRYLADCFKDIE